MRAPRPRASRAIVSILPCSSQNRCAWNTRFTSSWLLAVLLFCLVQPILAARVPFANCLSDAVLHDNNHLQFVPVDADAVFDLDNSSHNLQYNVYGYIKGGEMLQKPDLTQNPIKITTLHARVQVLQYEPYVQDSDWCADNLRNAKCPLGPPGPGFDPNNATRDELPYFGLSNDFYSTYAFTSFSPGLIIWYGDNNSTTVGCITSTVTPSLGGITWPLKFMPLLILLFVGFATAFAGIFSPWGTSDIFHWTSNYGRDPDLLRLVTPGFGDCLQYIQFIVLTGGLTLDYPGFYQPAVSQVSWSSLMFNESFVSHADPWHSVQDGIYVTNGVYGLHQLAQLVGMAQAEDIWAGMMIWLLTVIAASLFLIQAGFLIRWLVRLINNTPEEDLRAKNLPFSVGNVIRLVFSYFLLPIVVISTFQLVIAAESQVYLVALAALTLVVIVGFAAWLLYLIASTRPRAFLFDDLPTVVLYGPLYNTFSDEAAAFALIPVLLTFVRGIAIGAVQPSGITQIILLAICEVIQILTLHAFRPFHSPTSMNAYHTGFSVLRFATVLLMIAFAPNVGINDATKGWIGYAILLVHGGVLVFGFFLNALQTTIEVIARLCGAGGDDVRGQRRGGLSKIFGARQLQRRMSRRRGPSRQSQLSTTAMLDTEQAAKRGYGRVRSESAGSGVLLNNPQRSSSALDQRSIDAFAMPIRHNTDGASSFTPGTPGEVSTFSFLPSPGQATRPQPAITTDPSSPYYRPPRRRRDTINGQASNTPVADRARGSWASIDMQARRSSQIGGGLDPADLEALASGRVTPAPAPYAPVFAPRADYSTREVDFYYGVRGPALKRDGGGRRLGTGPADPTGPMASAAGWFRNLLGGKTKEKGKGFEVVRSSRMPPAMVARGGDFGDEGAPEGIPVAMGVLRNGPIESDDEDDPNKIKRKNPAPASAAEGDLLDANGQPREDDEDEPVSPVSDTPPALPNIDMGGSIHLPSRVQSKVSRQPSHTAAAPVSEESDSDIPDVPRKSSKRRSQNFDYSTPSFNLIPPTETSGSYARADSATPRDSLSRLPFERSNSQRRLSSASSVGGTEDYSNLPSAGFSADGEERPASFGYVHHHNINRTDPDREMDLLGTAAEVVDSSRKTSPGSSVSH